MISVARTPEPFALRKNKKSWLRALNAAATPAEVRAAEGKYRNPSVKSALIAMFHGKCAYCESSILHIDYGDIEHFRPKGLAAYRKLIFNWDNLLLSCGVCNGSGYKGDRFPGKAKGGPIINPCQEDPSDHLEFIYDAVARVATVVCKTKRGRVTKDLLGLK